MKTGRAPAGYHTELRVLVFLKNDTDFARRWSAPQSVSYCYGKARAWIRAEMKAAGKRGRSQIVGIQVSARYVSGEFKE